MTQGTAAEREAFETWLVEKAGWVAVPDKRANGTYINGQAQARWLGWKACADAWASVAEAALASQGALSPAEPVAPNAEDLLPHAYLFAKLAMVIPLFEEARDALTCITEAQRKLHGISSSLAARMDIAGTYSVDDWRASPPTPAPQEPKT